MTLAGFWSNLGTNEKFGVGLGFHQGPLYVPGQSTATKTPKVSFDGSNFDWGKYDWMLHADQWNKFRWGGRWLTTRGMAVHCLAPQPQLGMVMAMSFQITRSAIAHWGTQAASRVRAARCPVPQV